MPKARSTQPGSVGCTCSRGRRVDEGAERRRLHRHRAGAEQLAEPLRVEHRLVGEVVAAAGGVVDGGAREDVRDVLRVHDLQLEPLVVRYDGDERAPYDGDGHERPEEVAGLLRGGLALQHDGGRTRTTRSPGRSASASSSIR
jgi:hypothetical protein